MRDGKIEAKRSRDVRLAAFYDDPIPPVAISWVGVKWCSAAHSSAGRKAVKYPLAVPFRYPRSDPSAPLSRTARFRGLYEVWRRWMIGSLQVVDDGEQVPRGERCG